MPKEKKILVIDDSNTNVVLLEAILGTRGYDIKTALSVKEAMKLIEKEVPDLILLDLLMPDVSGFDFLENKKDLQILNHIPVIVISAVTDDKNIRLTRKLGAVEYIKKPVDIQNLVSTVEKILSQENASEQ